MELAGFLSLLVALLLAESRATDECCPSKEEMCSSLYSLRTKTLSNPGTSGSCNVTGDCTSMSCRNVPIDFGGGLEVPVSLEVTLVPCSFPYGVKLNIHAEAFAGSILNGTFTESTTLTVSVEGVQLDVYVDVTQHCYGVSFGTGIAVFGHRLEFVSSTNVSMFCESDESCSSESSSSSAPISSVTMATRSSVTMPTKSSSSVAMTASTHHSTSSSTAIATPTATPTSRPEECCPSKEEMCSSLYSLRTKTLSNPGTSGSCNVTGDCTSMSCALSVTYSGFTIPVTIATTLLSCSSPYGVQLDVRSPLLGTLVDDTFTESTSIDVPTALLTFTVHVDVTQHCYGVTLAAYADVGGNRLDFISSTDVSMFCKSCSIKSTSTIAMATKTPHSTFAPTATATPTGTPTSRPTCPPISVDDVIYNGSKPGTVITSERECCHGMVTHQCRSGMWEIVKDQCSNLACNKDTSVEGIREEIGNMTTFTSADLAVLRDVLRKTYTSASTNASTQSLPKDVGMIADKILDPRVDKWQNSTAVFDVLASLDKFSELFTKRRIVTEITNKNYVLNVQNVNVSETLTYPPPSQVKKLMRILNLTPPSVSIPPSVLANSAATSNTFTTSVAVSVFPKVKELLNRNSNGIDVNFIPVSPVLSVQVGAISQPQDVVPFKDPVVLTFDVSPPVEGVDQRCVYYDETTKTWLTRGISTGRDSSGHVVCESNHLTIFAVAERPLPTVPPSPSPSPSLASLHVYVYIGLGVNLACAAVAAIVVLLLWLLECKKGLLYTLGRVRQPVQLCLSVTIFLAMMVFILGYHLSIPDLSSCKLASGFLFYFSLSTVFWLVCDTGTLAYMVTKGVTKLPLLSYILLAIVGLVLPMIPVLVTSLLNPKSIVVATDSQPIQFCWIDWKDATIYGLIAPMIGASLVGVLYLVIVVKGLVCFKKGHARFTDKTENEMDIVEMPLRYNSIFNASCQLALIITTPVLWIFALLFVNSSWTSPDSIAFGVIFLFASITQGVFLVILTILGHRKVWMLLCGCCGETQADSKAVHAVDLGEQPPVELTARTSVGDSAQVTGEVSDKEAAVYVESHVTDANPVMDVTKTRTPKEEEGTPKEEGDELPEITDREVAGLTNGQDRPLNSQQLDIPTGKGGSNDNLRFSNLVFDSRREKSKSLDNVAMTTDQSSEGMTAL